MLALIREIMSKGLSNFNELEKVVGKCRSMSIAVPENLHIQKCEERTGNAAESGNVSELGKREKTGAGSSHFRKILGLVPQKSGGNLYCEGSGGIYCVAGA